MNRELKVLTYNIDGLPEQLDLNDLPWILKPISWIYKLIKKTTIIKVNDNIDTDKKMKEISKFLLESNADIIGVQEDFNYHNELLTELYDHYSIGKYRGAITFKKIFSNIELFSYFPLPRFKTDGLNILTKVVDIRILIENIIKWNNSYGYIDHANDLLTNKGYRYYKLLIDDKFYINVYIVHMDADFYHPENCPNITKDLEARKSQLNQLVNDYLIKYYNGNNYPTIIIGDTNSYDKYEWDKYNIQINLLDKINNVENLYIEEAISENYNDCDKIFYINCNTINYKLELKKCYTEKNIFLSDHKPLIGIFNIKENNYERDL